MGGNAFRPPDVPGPHSQLHRIHLTVRHLDPTHQWWVILAVVWLSHTQRPLRPDELLAALLAEHEYGSSITHHKDHGIIYDHFDIFELKSLLIHTRIISASLKSTLIRHDALYLLNLFRTNSSTLGSEHLHEMIAYACLRSIGNHNPTFVLTREESTMFNINSSPQHNFKAMPGHQQDFESLSSGSLIHYAREYWQFHFRFAEACSQRLAALLHRVIRTLVADAARERPSYYPKAMSAVKIGLFVCTSHDFPTTAQLCLDMGATFDELNYNTTSPLHSAAKHGSFNVLEIGLRQQPDLSKTDESGMTALHYAASRGHIEVVELLLRAGADVDQLTADSQRSAIHLAASAGHHIVANFLSEHSAQLQYPHNLQPYVASEYYQQTTRSLARQSALHPCLSISPSCLVQVTESFQTLSLVDQSVDSRTIHDRGDIPNSSNLHIVIEYR